MLEELKKIVCDENIRLKESGLVVLTWGNVSAIDREKGLVVIKPSGVDYANMKPEDMVVTDLDGKIVEGKLRPSSDLPTHLYLYKNFKNIGAVVHTHSTFATAFAQSGKPVIPFGTTHADAFYGNVPVTEPLTKEEVNGEYEVNNGVEIVKTFADKDPDAIPAVLVKNHGPFTWGKDARHAVDTAITLEEVSKMAYITITVNKKTKRIDQYLLDKHYFRKHGKNAYYGQKEVK